MKIGGTSHNVFRRLFDSLIVSVTVSMVHLCCQSRFCSKRDSQDMTVLDAHKIQTPLIMFWIYVPMTDNERIVKKVYHE